MDIAIKRKNIDLPTDVMQKLSILAASQGKSLKAYIEKTLIEKANSVTVDVHENPSPSGDEWFNDPENIASLERGLKEANEGKGRIYTADEIKKMLGL